MINKIKKVTIKDLLGIIKFLLLLIPAYIWKKYLIINHKEQWLICENKNVARDNGITFYKYMINNHPNIICYYAIDYSSPDYEKIRKLKNIVKWSSFKHYFLYMSSTKNISSHKEGNPNQTLFTILHLKLHLYNNRVFLQHGVLYQNHNMFHKENTRFKIFICGAKPEYNFIKEKYGYDKDEVRYTGLARFDNLHKNIKTKKTILYMPTWRRYLAKKNLLKNSDYFKNVSSFINSKKLEELLDKSGYILKFCPHDGLRDGMELFKTSNKHVKIIDIKSANVQELLKESEILITDFSSIHTDFAYMKKPIIYYQFDKIDFLTKHIGKCYKDTYYNYETDGFGKVVDNSSDLILEIEKLLKQNNKIISKEYLKRINSFFELNDSNNCKRIFNEIVRG